jgi:hypothetical protein
MDDDHRCSKVVEEGSSGDRRSPGAPPVAGVMVLVSDAGKVLQVGVEEEQRVNSDLE